MRQRYWRSIAAIGKQENEKVRVAFIRLPFATLKAHSTTPTLGLSALESTMIELHYWPMPNGHKITLFLEETGLPYTIEPANIGKGEQFEPAFLKISPNNRMPAIVDRRYGTC